MTVSSAKSVLVLGATGGAGYETAIALLRHGWSVRAMHRDPVKARARLPEAEWVSGDALRASDVVAAANGVQLIFHGVNPPGYRDWDKLVMPMLEATIAAAKATGARIIVPGNVYNYGPDAFPILTEDAPQNPISRKGAIRARMEARLREASASENVHSIVLRAGDFFGPHADTWFSQGMIRPGKPLTSVRYPGEPDIGHAWAYLPDFAEAVARLAERESKLREFENFHFAGHWFDRGVEIAERTCVVAGVPATSIRRFPWVLVDVLSPFVTLFHEMREMRYLWKTPVQLDNMLLINVLGEEPHTDIDTAIRRTLQAKGCLSDLPPQTNSTGLRSPTSKIRGRRC
ncbi:NAD-dependent epimerase/dehydratase family protein [Jannaschia formosa]|uniref:NAD-dependent epimerase/dehydratase family protein n=1 Tax=Jannaschia formosa TaxID=2259592 RepID=UPI000E1BB466|nr:NAD-dependent epimerase/dehydratase family protein [Jannaschia formosa]TFL15946.1 NAD-dependent epimerase/dehydratase family protein [Jannaschia formosa]